jgi:murein DD-endopeptidase MepM/ murein hydrolase activator NlpD
MPADLSAPLDSYLGVFRRRRTIAVGAAVICMLTVTVHDLPASAATIKQDAYTAASQRLTTTEASFAPVASREDFTMTEYLPVQWPLAPSTDVSSGFGFRIAPCWGCSSDHQGVDFDPGYGASIHVIADGVVVESAADGGLGQHLVIRHTLPDGSTVESVYGHMIYGSQTVGVGSKVKRGEVIGHVGSTGASTGPHLHFEIRPGGGDAIEPLAWLRKNVTEVWKG